MTPLEEALVRAAEAEQRLSAIYKIYRSAPDTITPSAAVALLNAIGRIAHDSA